MKITYADCILPVPLPIVFTYRVPDNLCSSIAIGKRVEVQLGSRRFYSAIVKNIHHNTPEFRNIKNIRQVLDAKPLVTENHLLFWDWIAEYYLCSLGEVMVAALPPALKLSSESSVSMNPVFAGDISGFSKLELAILENVVATGEQSVEKLRKKLEVSDIMRLVRNLVDKGALLLSEEMEEKYVPKMETCLAPGAPLLDELSLQEVFANIEKRAPRQLDVLMRFTQLCLIQNQSEAVLKSEVLKTLPDSASAALDQLIKKNLIRIVKRPVSRLMRFDQTHSPDSISLSQPQQTAFNELQDGLRQKGVSLLFGVTGSGKTEIYFKMIDKVIKEGKQVLFLLPEIALTSQIVNRLRRYFGDKVGLYHSKYNEHERTEIWKRVSDFENNPMEGFSIVLGARSALFLPFSRLGLVIVDEEHDPSYKQQSPAPRYHARDAAIKLAKMCGAEVILGSATPSYESFYNARQGKYHLVKLPVRYGHSVLPEILVSDVAQAAKRHEMKSHFSPLLIASLKEAKERNLQAILFQNRRGFASKMQCAECFHSPGCANCDVTLTYHKTDHLLKCHYCGYATAVPEKCPACQSAKLFYIGFGTQKIEIELPKYIQEIRISRMDLDTTRGKLSHQNILNEFEDGNVDVLVGTQMVTKGLDFDKVAVVGIIDADNMITFPDFRAFERSYQLIAQVSGRAGRKDRRGKVIIQTRMPHHPVIRAAIDNNYEEMYENEIADRLRFHYPPHYRLIQLTLQHTEQPLLNIASGQLADYLRKAFGKRILGPEYPPLSRIRNQYHKNILLKLEKNIDLKQAKKLLMDAIQLFESIQKYKTVRIVIDVDPV